MTQSEIAPNDTAQTQVITVRMSEEEHVAVKEAAWREKQSMNQWVRDAISAALKRTEEEKHDQEID